MNLTQTTLSAALAVNATQMSVASATGIVAPSGVNPPQKLYIIDPGGMKGELVTVVGVAGTVISIARLDLSVAPHPSGSIVLIAPADPSQGGFYENDPSGQVVGTPLTLPWVNVTSGRQWLASKAGVWVPGFNNPASPADVTAAVASAAGAITPSGPLFHVTGVLAVTGFTIPVGFAGGSFTVIPDGLFTWTNAGNIALAGSAVVSKALTFTYDANAGKFYPSYIA